MRKGTILTCLVVALLSSVVASQLPLRWGIVQGAQDSSANSAGSVSGLDQIREYSIPTRNVGPLAMVASPRGAFWFTEFSAGKIGVFFPANDTFREFQVPEKGARPASLAMDGSGQIWFSDQGGSGSIWRLDPSGGGFTQYRTPTTNSTPLGVTIDSKSNVWFAEITGNKLGELSYPSYSITEYSLPTRNSGPAEMALHPNSSDIWITETYGNKIAMFDMTSKSFTEFSPSFSMKSPVGIIVDGVGNVWVSEHGGSSIIELNPLDSSFRKYPTSVPPSSGGYDISAPATLAIDSQGNFWFVEHFSNKVGRLDPASNTMQEFVIPTQGAYSVLNALDSSGNFWFTEFSANQLGMIRANATSPVAVSWRTPQTLQVKGGENSVAEFVVTNKLQSAIQVKMNVSSSFTPTGQTSSAEVSFTPTALDLGPEQNETVRVTVTPDFLLTSGTYWVAVVANAGQASALGIVEVQVKGSSSVFQTLAHSPAVTLLGIGLASVLGYFVLRRSRLRIRRGARRPASLIRILLLGSSVPLALLPLVPTFIPASGKCPGIPTAGSGGPDWIDIILVVVLPLAAVGVILFLVIRDFLRRRAERWRSEQASPQKTSAKMAG